MTMEISNNPKPTISSHQLDQTKKRWKQKQKFPFNITDILIQVKIEWIQFTEKAKYIVLNLRSEI